MDGFIVTLIGLYVLFVIGYRLFKPKKRIEVFTDKGEFVTLNAKASSNVIFADVQKLKKTDIVKIQLAGSCLSLFNKSNHAIDIWINKHMADHTFSQASSIFPHAEKIIIES